MGTGQDNASDLENFKNIQAIIQYANLCFVAIFIIFLSYRLIRLRRYALSPLHTHEYPKTRIVLAIVYILLSISLLIYINVFHPAQNFDFKVILIGGGGQCFNSFVLLLQLAVLWQQLSKCQYYTRCHHIYSFFLMLISFVRLVCSIILEARQPSILHLVNMIISFSLTTDSCLLLVHWLKKKQKMTQFQYMTIENLKKNISYHMTSQKSDNMYLHNLSMTSNHQYIIPTVTVEKGNFRIILQIMVQNNILKDVLEETDVQKQDKNQNSIHNRHLQIISNSVFTLFQIQQIYIKCHKLPLETKLRFTDQINLGQFYQHLQSFLEEIFAQKNYYVPEILTLFDIPKESLIQYKKTNQIKQVYNIQNITFRPLNMNSSFISVSVYKQLWVNDHYIFYMDIRTIDGKDFSIPYKRYSDFEKFNQKLSVLVAERYKKTFTLPPLPKKQFFYWNDEVRKITERRQELQVYLQQICNDYELMNQFGESRQLIIKFLELKETFIIVPMENLFQQFYKGLQIMKGSITKALVNNQGVTYYEFKLFRKGILQKKISKRFNDFVRLHDTLQRWMENIKIQYRFIELPQKLYYKSEANRHEKLKKYLDSLITIQEVYKVYSVNCFFDVFGNSNDSSEEFLSIIKRTSSEKFQSVKGGTEREKREKKLEEESNKDFSMNSSNISNQRMSRLIEDLGN